MVCLSRLYPFKFFKGCFLQILLGPFLIIFYHFSWTTNTPSKIIPRMAFSLMITHISVITCTWINKNKKINKHIQKSQNNRYLTVLVRLLEIPICISTLQTKTTLWDWLYWYPCPEWNKILWEKESNKITYCKK